jgi:AcrR family transcriptional regulator
MNAAPTTIWERPERRGRGPEPTFTRAQLTEAGLGIADADGIAAVTIRAVAAEVGAGTASLYRYIENRDDLVDLMVDAAYAQMDLTPPRTHGIDGLVELAGRTRVAYLAHPWLLDVLATRTPIGPSSVTFLETYLGSLRDVDVPAGTKLETVAMLTAIIRLVTTEELSRSAVPTAGSRESHQLEYLTRLSTDGQHPFLAAALADAAPAPDPGEHLASLVRRIAGGLLHRS